MITKENQTANEIILEMVSEAFSLLRGARRFVKDEAKL